MQMLRNFEYNLIRVFHILRNIPKIRQFSEKITRNLFKDCRNIFRKFVKEFSTIFRKFFQLSPNFFMIISNFRAYAEDLESVHKKGPKLNPPQATPAEF